MISLNITSLILTQNISLKCETVEIIKMRHYLDEVFIGKYRNRRS